MELLVALILCVAVVVAARLVLKGFKEGLHGTMSQITQDTKPAYKLNASDYFLLHTMQNVALSNPADTATPTVDVSAATCSPDSPSCDCSTQVQDCGCASDMGGASYDSSNCGMDASSSNNTN